MRYWPPAALLVGLLCSPSLAARILVIGDSHTVGPFGSSLDKELVRQGHQVSLQAVCGASATWWLGPKRADLSICYALHDYGKKGKWASGKPDAAPAFAKDLLAARPDVVVFALGSNPDAGGAAGTGAAAEKLLALTPSSAKCLWIGPPPMPKRLAAIGAVYNELPQAFSRAGRGCALLDSRALISASDASPNDHFYGAPAEAWGKAAGRTVAASAGPVIP
jgi:hypothetical protein